MAIFEVMRESVQDADIGEFRSALVWIRPTEPQGRIVLVAPLGYAHITDRYAARIRDARRDGFTDDAIWEYWAANGGNGYEALRSRPETVEAESLDALTLRELQRIQG